MAKDHRTEIQVAKERIKTLEAELSGVGQTVRLIVDAMDDEGDRIYLGSTNDADDLRSLADDSEVFIFDRDLPTPQFYRKQLSKLDTENRRLLALINTPETEDFMMAVPLEAAHQIERWGVEHDAAKSPWDWYWTLATLAGKAVHSSIAGDWTKAKHHTITAAALLANWHRRMSMVDS